MDTHCFSRLRRQERLRRASFCEIEALNKAVGSHDATLANHANQRRHFQADLSISARFPPKEVMGCLTTSPKPVMVRLSHHRLTSEPQALRRREIAVFFLILKRFSPFSRPRTGKVVYRRHSRVYRWAFVSLPLRKFQRSAIFVLSTINSSV